MMALINEQKDRQVNKMAFDLEDSLQSYKQMVDIVNLKIVPLVLASFEAQSNFVKEMLFYYDNTLASKKKEKTEKYSELQETIQILKSETDNLHLENTELTDIAKDMNETLSKKTEQIKQLQLSQKEVMRLKEFEQLKSNFREPPLPSALIIEDLFDPSPIPKIKTKVEITK